MKETATMTSKGQITIPNVIRKALNLKDHDRIVFEMVDDKIILTPKRESVLDLYGVAKSRHPVKSKADMRSAAKADLAARWKSKQSA